MKVKVQITETLQRVVCVDANDNNEAIIKVATDYADGNIVLNADDFVEYKFDIYEDK